MTDTDALTATYRERAHLAAHLAAGYPSVLVDGADANAPDWPVLFVKLPTGQVSWHISPDDRDLFAHVRRTIAGMPDAPVWDGHSTDEKYARVHAHTLLLASRKEH
jgi:hypothetical protein